MSSFFPVSEILRKYFNVLASQDLILDFFDLKKVIHKTPIPWFCLT